MFHLTGDKTDSRYLVLSRIVQPGGQITDYAYDEFGAISSVRDGSAADAIGAGLRSADNSTTTSLSYDSLGRINSVAAPSAPPPVAHD